MVTSCHSHVETSGLMLNQNTFVPRRRRLKSYVWMRMVGLKVSFLFWLSLHSIIGMEHSILFIYCTCEPLAITLARAELWPASPTNPQYSFSFSLLDWAEALLLEAQVSLKDFCSSLKFRCRIQGNKVNPSSYTLKFLSQQEDIKV